MSKQDLINFYRSKVDEYTEAAKECQEKAKRADEMDAYHFMVSAEEHTTIASLCRGFVENLNKLEESE